MYNFDELWNNFSEKLFHYIKSQVSSEHDAEDILQNVFIKIYKSIEQLENQAAIKPWIYMITKRTIIDFYKKKKDVSVAPETFNGIKDEIEEMDNMNDDISKCIGNMLFTLPEKYQSVYDMYENKEMKHKEIAEKLDISLSTSKVRLNRAKQLFKDKLLVCCDFEVDKYGNIINYESKGNCHDCNGQC